MKLYHPKKAILFPSRGERKPREEQDVLFIDPGLDGTGYAFYNKINCNKVKVIFEPFSTGTFRPKRTGGWLIASADVFSWFEGLVVSLDPKLVVIEMPEAWLSSSKGIAAAQRGDVLKLSYLVGGLAHVLQAHNIAQPMLIAPREWKGQLPKTVCEKRVRKVFSGTKYKGLSDHEYDAIGMGLAAQGGL